MMSRCRTFAEWMYCEIVPVRGQKTKKSIPEERKSEPDLHSSEELIHEVLKVRDTRAKGRSGDEKAVSERRGM